MLKLLEHSEIDKQKWDKSIENSKNRIVYACSWYLDALSPDWTALIYDDYRFIMPLPQKKRFGFTYYTQPVFAQQLGIFSSENITPEIHNDFLSALDNFKYFILNVNFCPDKIYSKNITIEELVNYTLNLNKSYDELKAGFSQNTKRNIKKACHKKLQTKIITQQEFTAFYAKHGYSKKNTNSFIRLMDKNKNAFCFYGVFSDVGKLISANAFLQGFDRYINLAPVSSAEGMKSSAMFLLLNHFIEEKAGSDTLLDFEGSMIEGIAYFYKGFGGKNEAYYLLHKEDLSSILKLVKNIKGSIVHRL